MTFARKRAMDHTETQRTLTLRSPKELIRIMHRSADNGEGFKVERVGAKKVTIKWTCHEVTGDSIRSHIAILKNWAISLLVDHAAPELPRTTRHAQQSTNETPPSADRTYWARRVLQKLDGIERKLIKVECAEGTERIQHAFAAIYDAVVLATEVHLLTVVDNEEPIVRVAAMRAALATKRKIVNTARHARRTREWEIWNAEAQNVWERQPRLSRQAVATRVKAKLRLTEKVRTIAKRLKKLARPV